MDTNGQQSLLDSVQGYYATTALLRLHRLGILEHLAKPKNSTLIANEFGIDGSILEQVLEFLTLTTSVIDSPRKGIYRLRNVSVIELVFNLEKFAGAYGPALQALPATSRVDLRALAGAFVSVSDFVDPIVPEMIRDAGIRHLLDLGCGTASLLIALARNDPGFRGVGLDRNPHMYKCARRAVRSAGLANRITIRHADGADLAASLSKEERSRIDGVHGRSFLNEFFGRGDLNAVRVLRHLHRHLPGRKAWFVDYFGQLGHKRSDSGRRQLTLLQDLAQTVSGQGVPPPSTRAWHKIYEKTLCRLLGVQEFETADIGWFVHEVIL